MNSATFNSILVPLDGSTFDQRAAAYGIYIAKRLNIPLIALPVGDDLKGSSTESIFLRTFLADCHSSGISPDFREIPDLSANAISTATKEATDSLLLLPQREPVNSRNKVSHTMESAIQSAAAPLMIIPPKFLEIESMGLIYDGNPEADQALDLAVSISVKAVWPLTILLLSEDQHQIAILNRQLDDYFERHADDAIDWDTVALYGQQDETVLQFIRDGSIELLVMVSPGQSPFLTRICQESPIPLITIP